MNLEEMGKIIKERRQDLKLKQKDLADLADVNINTIVNIERGKCNTKMQTLFDISNVLGLEIIIK